MPSDRTPEQIAAVTRAICRERCAFMGEPPCFEVCGDDGEALPWPNPQCDDPGCEAMARAAVLAIQEARASPPSPAAT
ncbi:hypothetical protein [Falsiroseomonas tokyonensis]|uniref:Ferredoxin n=1 Tax=Falsiroseomonas tokyonensis TaxID=430521 RepID=A0ABV7C2W0_9PROT|nr:hypothetical protein [Falsiroseomonas tokyonensis]MBU8540793.1 hypothetical protein [Falsiroseomonas tokyonensis]